MTEVERQSSLRAVNHPAQPGWLEAGREAAEVITQLDGTTLSVVLAVASIRSDDYRQYFHEINWDRYLKPPSPGNYNKIAGHPEYAGEQIRWFGRMALGAFRRPIPKPEDNHEFGLPIEYPFDQVALELGGVRQLGGWDSSALDALVARIGLVDDDKDLGLKVRMMKRPGERRTSYRVLPVLFDDMDPDAPLEFGIVRRRRAVADVYLPATPTDPPSIAEISKESTGIYVVDRIEDERDYRILHHSPRIYRAVEKGDLPINDNMLASAAGRLFEAAIATHKKGGEPEAVMPVSAHLIMLSRRSGSSQA